MDAKDHRMEIRLPQQQITELDGIIASLDTHFKPTRSDVVRSFIAQGIERHYGRSPKDESSTSLTSKLILYFQWCQLQQMIAESRKVVPLGHRHKQQYYRGTSFEPTSNIAAYTLVRQVYLRKLNWFFELDKKSLDSIDPDLGRDDVLTLMAPQPSLETCAALADVIAVRTMFLRIGEVVDEAEKKIDTYNYSDVREKLARIKGYADDKALPLRFEGYPDSEDWKLYAEMLAVLEWIDNGQAYALPHTLCKTPNQDFTTQYATMLQIFQELSHDQYFNLDMLLDMVKDRRL
ncbi:hypothetical protein ACS91J_03285 [Pectobacterium carotovorum]|nr:hypothetical protein PEC301877_19420 [Pectobacterium carotovorum subsp. carotovorum]